ncbi:hypothetical protein D3C86_1289920 [compost metagenome]
MPLGLPAEQLPVVAVGEQQLGLVSGQHGHGGIQALQHGREAVVRGGQFLAGALGLGDVRHRTHPARMAAPAVHQRRDVHPCEEAAAVAAHHAHLVAGGGRLALQRQVDLLLHLLLVVGRPVGERRHAADQGALGPARHAAEGGVHIRDAAVQVERAQADQHRVFHRPAERGLGQQGALRLGAAAGVPPHAPQAPEQEAGQAHHQPQQHVVRQVRRRRVGIRAQRKRMPGWIKQHFVGQRIARHGPQRRARARLVVLVDEREAVALRQLGRQQVGQDAVDRIERAEGAEELVVPHDRHFHQHEAVAALVHQRAGVDHALGLAGGVEGVEDFRLQRMVDGLPQPAGKLRRGRQRPAAAPRGIEPVHKDDFRVLSQDFLRGRAIGSLVELRGGDVARQRGQLVLVAQQREPHALLRPGGVAVQRIALLLAFGLVQ